MSKMSGNQRKAALKWLLGEYDSCWICGCEIDTTLPREHDEAPTIDHYIPRAQGGSNAHENLRLAHRICNGIRGNVNMTGESRGVPESLRRSRYVKSTLFAS